MAIDLVGFRPEAATAGPPPDVVRQHSVSLLVHPAGAVVGAGEDHDHVEGKENGYLVSAVRTSRRTITPFMVTRGARAATESRVVLDNAQGRAKIPNISGLPDL